MSEKRIVQELDKVSIRFSGDSGDGMQLTGTLFSETSAFYGNDISTFPDFPSEIRAPQGTIAGVSGFQVHVGKDRIKTPGDFADVLVAMNPAALKANLKWVKKGGTIVVDVDSFDEKGLKKANYDQNPLEDGTIEGYQMIYAPITTQTKAALSDTELDNKDIIRCKNMFALGITYYMFHRPMEHTFAYFENKFKKKPILIDANKKALEEGYKFAQNTQALTPYRIEPADIEKGVYKSVNGNTTTAWGLMAAAEKAGLKLFLGSYPITPATDILQELVKYKSLGVKTFQAEDEIAGICTAIGASFSGNLAVTTTSGPGLALKSEAIGLAIIMEIPLVIVDVQRGGPSTGLPTKTEQSDLMQAIYGRNGDAPCIVICASTPSNCFDYAYMACKLSLEHMTPVILLTDGFIANGTQPWKLRKMADMPQITTRIVTEKQGEYTSFLRDDAKLSRNWVIPGTPELMFRVGGLEKHVDTGLPSHMPLNHKKMTAIRKIKVNLVENFIPLQTTEYASEGELLVVGWGGTYGHLVSAVAELHADGKSIGLAHFNYINPLPKNVEEVFGRYKKIIVCELNLGQFANYLRMKMPHFQYIQHNKVQGIPFIVEELKTEFLKHL